MANISNEELNAIQELKNQMKNLLTSLALTEDEDIFLCRFLRARDLNVDKAEKMLKKHIYMRKVYQVDRILEIFKPKEVFVKCVQPRIVGLDKNRDIVLYLKAGQINSTELMKCMKFHDLTKHWFWLSEMNKSLNTQQPEKKRQVSSVICIMDLDGLEFGNATAKISADICLRFIQILQDNYPEGLKSISVINAPSFFVFVFSILKAIMTSRTLRKIHVFGYSGWKEHFLENIDADVLPAFLGGKLIDPDGDPNCKSYISAAEKISQTYYLSEEERYFKDPMDVSTLIIRPSEKKNVFVDVKEVGLTIQWRFRVKSKTIKFGLFFQESHNVTNEIIPMHEYDTPDGTEENSYKCLSKGKYIVVFDNSNSKFTTKEVQYIISVEEPEV